jgi:hypothetical protein
MDMRSYKFRGKRLDNEKGDWVYGDLLHIAGGCLIYFGSDTDTAEPDIENSSSVAVELLNDEIAVVDPDTVCQFSGIVDKNGVEIFDCDILRVTFIDPVYLDLHIQFYHTFVVGRKKGCFILKGDRTLIFNDNRLEPSMIEVIGNIHDNPELLKGGTNGTC